MNQKERMDIIATIKMEIMDKHEFKQLIGCGYCKHTKIYQDGIGRCNLLTDELRRVLAEKGIYSNIKVEVTPDWVCESWEN